MGLDKNMFEITFGLLTASENGAKSLFEEDAVVFTHVLKEAKKHLPLIKQSYDSSI